MLAEKVEEANTRTKEVAKALKAEGKKPRETVLAERISNMDQRSLLEAIQLQQVV